ncbi:hypothetical protein PLICRDRAFT_40979 [Plicaturopsis crispa FD-325 SS-3]|nr:hypothetical protein PLICRDRAFT_40979 [Plicaturopsis crispa FD-325 SS-3]
MQNLEPLESITRLSDHVVRVLGQNPGKFTLQGTNTYIVGSHNPYTLIDTGEGRDEYIPVLETALRETAKSTNAQDPDISDIIISHWHGDHVGGLPSVLALLRKLWDERNTSAPFQPPRIHKFPTSGIPPGEHNKLPSILESLPPNSFAPHPRGTPLYDLRDSQVFPLPSSSLLVIHTPGHTTDSIALYIPEDKALYTADTVLGQGTSVFDDLGTYLDSLNKMLDFRKGHATGYTKLYPGHGPVVADGPGLIETYVKHRLQREKEIVEVLKGPRPEGAEGPWTLWTIVASIYAAYPQNLWEPAAYGVQLHLKKLEGDGRVKLLGGEGKDGQWEYVGDVSRSYKL